MSDTNDGLLLKPRAPIAIIRLEDLTEAVAISRALAAGGIFAQEYTFTNPQALNAIRQVREALSEEEVSLGVGTVLNADAARASIAAGAEFLVTPIVTLDVIEVARAQGVPVVCGAMTPTEIFTAVRAGAEYVKVFPARSLGPAYLRDVLAPLPGLRLVPTGGVHLDNCAAFLSAGAYTVAIGSQLVSPEIVRRKDWDALTKLAQQYVQACAQ